ncbi:MAG: DUF488 family protein [Desulfurococcales archaeon]|nr:DUF488 family protein [Desulfurococcales archaeon]
MQIEAYTIGHSNRRPYEFLSILKHYNIEVLVDVRRWPKSRKYPWFNMETLKNLLEEQGIRYTWLEPLGGYRRFNRDVEDHGIARCFESQGFRAYATYILVNSRARETLEKLESIVRSHTTAIMCSERLPWMCHRKIISDWLLSRNIKVIHIIDRDYTVEHKLTKCAKIEEGSLTYT